MQLLVYRTPQFVYFVIPIAALLSVLVTFGLLSRTSELTVMKACGISLYRIARPVVLLSLLFSAALFALDQEILARANRRANAIDDQIRGRPPKTFNPLNRRWVIGRDGSIYHYGFFDPRSEMLTSLTMYRLRAERVAPGVADLCGDGRIPRDVDRRQRLDPGLRRRIQRNGESFDREQPADRVARLLQDRRCGQPS